MRIRPILILSLLACTAAALAADDALNLRPGRWEFTTTLDMPAGTPAGMPLSEPMVETSCVLPEASDLMAVSLPAFAAEEGCKVREYASKANEVSFEAICDGVTMSLKWTRHSPDAVSGYSESHSKDPSQKLAMKFAGRRIGDTCTAEETAEAREAMAELKAMLKK